MKDLRSDFPMLATKINGNRLVYLDSAATSQKPKQVLDAMYSFYAQEYATVGRGMYSLAEAATQRYEKARACIAHFINAKATDIVFTSGSTHGMNMLADGWGTAHIKEGDEIVMADWEHHSTMLPWQHLAALKGAKVRYIPVLPNGTLDESSFDSIINKRTKVVVLSHVSNVFGSTIPVEKLVSCARKVGAHFFLDAAQSAPHGMIDVQELEVDALVFSGHKMGGPTGIGVLYLNKRMQEEMPAYHIGGGMVYEADYEKAIWRKAPHKFEAGTPPFAQAIGLAAAIEYMQDHLSFDELRVQQAMLCAYLIQGLSLISRARVHGPLKELSERGHLVSFELENVPAHDAAAILGSRGICVRAGNLCAQPLAKKLGLNGLIRASFYMYTTKEDVDALLAGIQEVVRMF